MNPASGVTSGRSGSDTISGLEEVEGSVFEEKLIGRSGDDSVAGAGGADIFVPNSLICSDTNECCRALAATTRSSATTATTATTGSNAAKTGATSAASTTTTPCWAAQAAPSCGAAPTRTGGAGDDSLVGGARGSSVLDGDADTDTPAYSAARATREAAHSSTVTVSRFMSTLRPAAQGERAAERWAARTSFCGAGRDRGSRGPLSAARRVPVPPRAPLEDGHHAVSFAHCRYRRCAIVRVRTRGSEVRRSSRGRYGSGTVGRRGSMGRRCTRSPAAGPAWAAHNDPGARGAADSGRPIIRSSLHGARRGLVVRRGLSGRIRAMPRTHGTQDGKMSESGPIDRVARRFGLHPGDGT